MNRFLQRLLTRTGVVSSIAALLVAVIFLRLGLWQLDRAAEKTHILERQSLATTLEPLESLKPGDEHTQLYRRVKLAGIFDFDRQFLLDNRTVNGQPGYDVIVPFFLGNEAAKPVGVDGGEYILVNRGWIGHSGNRAVTIEQNAELTGRQSIEGILATPSRGFTLGDALANSENNWPVVLQFIDYETIAAKLDKIPLLPAVIIAAAGQPVSYVSHWKPVASGAEKHLGYAFQWFAMLAALIALYLYLMVFKNDRNNA